MDNELSSLTSDDFQVQLEQLQKIEAEEKARELVKQEIFLDYSYQEIIKKGVSGFMEFYVIITGDDKTMTTRAKRDVVLSLAKSDLLRDLTFITLFSLGTKSVSLSFRIVYFIICLNLNCFIHIYKLNLHFYFKILNLTK